MRPFSFDPFRIEPASARRSALLSTALVAVGSAPLAVAVLIGTLLRAIALTALLTAIVVLLAILIGLLLACLTRTALLPILVVRIVLLLCHVALSCFIRPDRNGRLVASGIDGRHQNGHRHAAVPDNAMNGGN
ncbi:MAG: hypothetical protein U5M50_04330 [Sphingobium sp.]|nr:hypothetical protein [Sphingobium sp.]